MARSRPTARSLALGFARVGMSWPEATNLAAVKWGLRPSARTPWTPTEIERIRFLRALWVVRAIGGPTDSPSHQRKRP